MVDFTVQTNALELSKFLNGMRRKQLPYATSRTVNGMAFEARHQEQSKLNRYFKLRTNYLKKKGAMPLTLSNKRQFPDIHSVVAVKDEIAAMSATGGIKKASSNSMAVPLSGITRPYLNPGKETLTRGKWPKNIVKKVKTKRRPRKGRKPKPFIAQLKAGTSGVYIREQGKMRLTPLYVFKDQVKVNKTWPLVENISNLVAKQYSSRLAYELDRAMR